jgi:hypothetical protein
MTVKTSRTSGRDKIRQLENNQSNSWGQVEEKPITETGVAYTHTASAALSVFLSQSMVHLMKHSPYIYCSCCRRTQHIASARVAHMTLNNTRSSSTWTGRLSCTGEWILHTFPIWWVWTTAPNYMIHHNKDIAANILAKPKYTAVHNTVT